MSYVTGSGQRLQQGRSLGKGGEGEAFIASGHQGLAFKVYGKRTDLDQAEQARLLRLRRDKIEAMIKSGLASRHPLVAFPKDTLFATNGAFVGFTMQLIDDSVPIHQLYDSRDRKDHFPAQTVEHMVHAAVNLSKAIDVLHSSNCVIGDINEGGIFVRKDGFFALIDCDSFQFTHGGRVHPCLVMTPIYQPPENQGKSARDLGNRTPNQDNFGLAFMIFRLLMSGLQPFTGRYLARGETPRPGIWVRDHLYVYGEDAAQKRIAPPAVALSINWLSDELRQAFELAFGPQGRQRRPSASDWAALLERFMNSLVSCGSKPFHYHLPGKGCAWCKYERELGGPVIGPGVLGYEEQKIRPRPGPKPPPPTPPAPAPAPLVPPKPSPKPSDGLPWPGIGIGVGILAMAAGLYSLGQPSRQAAAPVQAPAAVAYAAEEQPVQTVSAAPVRYATSFECDAAREWSEQAVCGNQELAAMDRSMATLYRSLAQGVGPGIGARLKSDQADWLGRRRACGDETCLDSLYRERVSTLQGWADNGLPWTEPKPVAWPVGKNADSAASAAPAMSQPASGPKPRQRSGAAQANLIVCSVPSRSDGAPSEARMTPEDCDRSGGIPN